MSFDLNAISSALNEPNRTLSGVDYSGKSLKLDTEKDAQPIVDAINSCPNLQYLTLTGNTLGVAAAQAIAKALSKHPELKSARFSDMFTGRMKTEIPPALSALGDGMIEAGARLSILDLSDNAFGPIGVEGLAKLLQSDVCSELEELYLNNNGLGITGGRLLAKALSANPRRLKIFIAGRNRLENEGAKALAAVFQSMGTLEELAMPQNGIYHIGISALSEAFKHNPRLARLNLNDNTVGPRGAAAIAGALPKLKNLRAVNFGDCLLKSSGAKALAKGFRDNAVLLESLDLSHNEIGREACTELVDAVTALGDSRDRLTRVVLAGNSLGGAARKQALRLKLGPAAELSDGDASDDDYVSGSEDESDDDKSEDSATEDAQHLDSSADVSNDIDLSKTDVIEEVDTDVSKFLLEPTLSNFAKLGSNACDVIDAHLQSIHEPERRAAAYAEALCGACSLRAASARAAAASRTLWTRVADKAHLQWPLANALLRALQLIKSENKEYQVRWRVSAVFLSLAEQIDEEYFPAPLRETLKFFISSKRETLPPEVRAVLDQHPNLYN